MNIEDLKKQAEVVGKENCGMTYDEVTALMSDCMAYAVDTVIALQESLPPETSTKILRAAAFKLMAIEFMNFIAKANKSYNNSRKDLN